jgi:hypothetical protein
MVARLNSRASEGLSETTMWATPTRRQYSRDLQCYKADPANAKWAAPRRDRVPHQNVERGAGACEPSLSELCCASDPEGGIIFRKPLSAFVILIGSPAWAIDLPSGARSEVGLAREWINLVLEWLATGIEVTGVSDASCRHNRGRSNRIDHARDQAKRRNLSAHVSACLPALRHNDIHPSLDGTARICGIWSSMKDNCPSLVNAFDQRGRITPEQGDDRDTFLQTGRQSVLLIKIQYQIDRRVSAFISRIWRRTPSRSTNERASIPSPPALLTAAASFGQLAPPMATWMIGRSIPSLSHKAVFMPISYRFLVTRLRHVTGFSRE